MAMNFETSLLSNSKLESNGSAKPHHTKMDDSASSNFEVKSITADEALEDLEERREMLRQFLQRSLSQSAKSSQMQIKPAGILDIFKPIRLKKCIAIIRSNLLFFLCVWKICINLQIAISAQLFSFTLVIFFMHMNQTPSVIVNKWCYKNFDFFIFPLAENYLNAHVHCSFCF